MRYQKVYLTLFVIFFIALGFGTIGIANLLIPVEKQAVITPGLGGLESGRVDVTYLMQTTNKYDEAWILTDKIPVNQTKIYELYFKVVGISSYDYDFDVIVMAYNSNGKYLGNALNLQTLAVQGKLLAPYCFKIEELPKETSHLQAWFRLIQTQNKYPESYGISNISIRERIK